MRIGNRITRDDRRPHRRKRIARFPTLPLSVCELEIASTDVVEGCVTEHVVESPTGADVLSPSPDDNRKLSFVIYLHTRWWQHDWLTWRDHCRGKLRKHDRPFGNRHITFGRVVAIVESDAYQLAGTWYRSKPIRFRSLDQPTLVESFSQEVGIPGNRFIGCARLLKPWTVHVQPRQLTGWLVRTLKSADKIQQVLMV